MLLQGVYNYLLGHKNLLYTIENQLFFVNILVKFSFNQNFSVAFFAFSLSSLSLGWTLSNRVPRNRRITSNGLVRIGCGVQGRKTAIEERLQQTFRRVVKTAPYKPSRFTRIVTLAVTGVPLSPTAAISKLILDNTSESFMLAVSCSVLGTRFDKTVVPK